MINFCLCLLISVMVSCGAAILLVEKGNDFPIKKYRVLMQKWIHDHIGWRWAQVLFCSTCSSFWITLIIDCFLCVFSFIVFGSFYFFWPFSGFIVAGLMWCIVEYLNAIDKDPNINVFVDNKGEENEDLSNDDNSDPVDML